MAASNPLLMGMYGQTPLYQSPSFPSLTPDQANTLSTDVANMDTGVPDPSTSMFGKFFGGALDQTDAKSKITQQGWLSPAISGASALAGGFLGMQQYGLAKATLAQQKSQFDANYNNQRTLTNANLQDRQSARVAAGAPGAYQSVASYMTQNGIK